MPNILLIDDDQDALTSLMRALASSNLEIDCFGASTIEKSLEILKKQKPDVVVLDLCIDESKGIESGFELLTKIKQISPVTSILMLTGHGAIENGVKALNLGASSFLEKPANIPHLVALISDGLKRAEILKQFSREKEFIKKSIEKVLIGKSEAISKLRKDILFASSTSQPVLLLGETGTGKSFCAKAIHDFSKRVNLNFVRYQPNYGSSDIVASDLFGHSKGSFTGAEKDREGLVSQANGGTLFLDDVDQLPAEVQVSLLSVIQEKKVRPLGANAEKDSDFRLVSATNADINKAIEEKMMRTDFYHRIGHFAIKIPPLRERMEDIQIISNFFLEKMRLNEEVNVFGFDESCYQKLEKHSWPGNVRELIAVVEGAAYRAQFENRDLVLEKDIVIGVMDDKSEVSNLTFQESVSSYKKRLVNEALERNQNNQVQTAKELGIDRSTLRRILLG